MKSVNVCFLLTGLLLVAIGGKTMFISFLRPHGMTDAIMITFCATTTIVQGTEWLVKALKNIIPKLKNRGV